MKEGLFQTLVIILAVVSLAVVSYNTYHAVKKEDHAKKDCECKATQE